MGTLDELRKKINNQTASLGEIFVKLTEGESLTRSQKSEVRSQKKKRKN